MENKIKLKTLTKNINIVFEEDVKQAILRLNKYIDNSFKHEPYYENMKGVINDIFGDWEES